jgi:hypothetical protein
MSGLRQYLVPYVASNLVALALLFIAWRRPRVAQWLCALVFLWASITNVTTAINRPHVYQEYAALTPVAVYKNFITGWFNAHAREMVLAIAVGQLAIAVLLMLRRPGRVLGVLGAIVFLMAIAPLGVGSAFPFSLTFIAAIVVMDRRRRNTQHII